MFLHATLLRLDSNGTGIRAASATEALYVPERKCKMASLFVGSADGRPEGAHEAAQHLWPRSQSPRQQSFQAVKARRLALSSNSLRIDNDGGTACPSLADFEQQDSMVKLERFF